MVDKKELYYLLKGEQIEEFNRKVEGQRGYDLQDVNLRGRNLQNADLQHADLRGAYLNRCNLKGLNLTHANMEGSSMHMARISGTYFPHNVSAMEIQNAVNFGTRIRVSDSDQVHESTSLLT